MTNEITPNGSACPVFIEEYDPAQIEADKAEAEAQAAALAAKTIARQALLEKLGITEEEAQLLLGGI
jgi:hypothetical protein